MRSPVPNRKALFDLSIAGRFGRFVVTLPLLILGFWRILLSFTACPKARDVKPMPLNLTIRS